MPPSKAILTSADVSELYGWFMDLNSDCVTLLHHVDELIERGILTPAEADNKYDQVHRMLHWSHSMANVIAPF